MKPTKKRKTIVHHVKQLVMTQIVVAQWGGNTYSIIGLEKSGRVYRYSIKDHAWVAYGNTEHEPCDYDEFLTEQEMRG